MADDQAQPFDEFFSQLDATNGAPPPPPQSQPQVTTPQPQAAPGGVTISEAKGGPSYPPVPKGPLYGEAGADLYPPGSGAENQLLGLPEKPLGNPTSFLDAAAGGAAQGVYAAKDFLSGGSTPEDQRSQTRKNIDNAVANESIPDQLVTGIAQFAVGMLGAGKLATAAEAAPAVGGLFAKATSAIGGWSTSAKAAVVGATFFDPHSANIGNIVQSIPALQNPVTNFLASSPEDGEAIGRVKNAMASIGLDAAITGVFAATLGLVKAMRGGTPAAIQEAHAELDAAVQGHQEAQANAVVPQEQPQEPVASPEAQVQPKTKLLPSADIAADVPGALKSGSVDAMRFADAPSLEHLEAIRTAGEAHEGSEVDRLFGEHSAQVKKWMRSKSDKAAEQLEDFIDEEYGTKSPQYELVYGSNDAHIYNGESISRLHDRIQGVDIGVTDAVNGDPSHLEKELAWIAPKLPDISKPIEKHTEQERTAVLALAYAFREIQREGLNLEDLLRGATDYTAHRVSGDAGDTWTLLERLPAYIKQLKDEGHEEPQAPRVAATDGAQAEEVRRVDSPTQGAKPGSLPPKAKLIAIPDDQLEATLSKVDADMEELIKNGSWDAAVDNGHVFGTPEGGVKIPWHTFVGEGGTSTTENLDALLEQVADRMKSKFDQVKGGDVISDAMNDRMVAQRVVLWGEDPAALMGLLQAAGAQAGKLRANMDAAYLLASKAMQDTYTLAARVNAGYLEDFGGSRAAAMASLKQMNEVAATLYSLGNAMSANAGRAVRGMRGEFAPTPMDLEAMRGLDPEMLLKLYADTKGDPRAMIPLLKPELWSKEGMAAAAMKFGQGAQYLMINGLVSNPLTHAVILATNTYQIISRPLERIAGSAWLHLQAQGREGSAIRQEALKQYYYMSAVLHDSFTQAVSAWKVGDSIMAPHETELQPGNMGLAQTVAQMPWKSMDSVPNIISNLWAFTAKSIGLPTRFVGFQDELVKQVVYRSKVMANASVEGQARGITGQELTDYVKQKLTNAFDAYGRATDLATLNEAKIATYQQDLPKTGNFGLGTASSAVQAGGNLFPPLRLILPFIKTPANLFRNAVKLTPGLNVLQKEYRDALSGALGPEQQAQAVGQMSMGSLFMGTAAVLSHNGMITGGAPSDPALKDELLNSGWRPYSLVFKNADGTKTYFNYNRFDPAAMPFAMVADIMDVLQHPDPVLQSKAESLTSSLFVSILKGMTDKLYLSNLSQTIEAVTEPDKHFGKSAGRFAGGFIPFSSALRASNLDPYQREALTFMDTIKRGVPGFSETVSPKYDFTSQPVTIHKGVWMTDGGDPVDREAQRIALDQRVSLGPPQTTTPHGVDLRTLNTTDGRNAYERLNELTSQPAPGMMKLRDQLRKVIDMPAYVNAPDGASNDKGTKTGILTGVIDKYRQAGMKALLGDKNVSEAEHQRAKNTAAAYANSKPSPTPQNLQSNMMSKMGAAMGVDLHTLAGATGTPTPAPLAGPPVGMGGQ